MKMSKFYIEHEKAVEEMCKTFLTLKILKQAGLDACPALNAFYGPFLD